ncbi:type III pantothenate kinase [bacterium]|nr:type III pantothenate kinase [bacterium]
MAARGDGARRVATLNVGNSRLHLGLCSLQHLPPCRPTRDQLAARLPDPASLRGWEACPADSPDASHLASAVADTVKNLQADRVVLVSVVPDWSQRLAGVIPELEIIDHTWSMPFSWGVDQPSQVGADRLANMALARAWGLEEALVVDAGTATTFDLLADGVFQGGLIAPGMAFAARKLGEYAARLDVVPFAPAPVEIGRDTASAMAAGAWLTGVHGILGTIDALQEKYGPSPVVLTGGLGAYLAGDSRVLDPFWTLRGAAWLSLQRSGDLNL